jgi:Malectin domain
MQPGDSQPAASVSEVRDEIQTISQSRLFAQSRRRIKLLEYLCDMVLVGRQDEIKETTIALELFERTSEFDDKKDAIVRVEAHRLRERLAKYYATEGSNDPVVIELAPGGYVPRFISRAPEKTELTTVAVADSPVRNRWFEPRWKLMVLAAALLAFALSAALGPSRRGSVARMPNPQPAAVPPVLSSTGAIRILAGSTKPYMDRAGRSWHADNYFTGGVAQPGPEDFLGRPPDPSLYRSMRYGDFSYSIPAPAGVYELWLHFAEPNYRSGTGVGSEGGENERHFTVLLNGTTLLHDFDVVTDSGMSPVDVRAFRDVSPSADGMVHLQFQAVVGPPFLNAIELVPGSPGRMRPIRIRAGDSSVTDHAGNVWNPDNYYIGGRLATHKQDVFSTQDPDLYASERYGNFNYAIPVPPGRYAVTLYFAETYWDPEAKSSNKGGVGSRVFSVSCNGAVLLPEFDILKEAKPFQAVSHTFHNLKPNGQGKLLLSFSPVVNYASVKAIEVKDEQDRQLR